MLKVKITSFCAVVLLAIVISCKKPRLESTPYSEEPSLPATADNYDNSQNDNLATLGRVLFYDPKLSLNNSVSCGSCHQQSKAFCDNKQFSIGLEDKLTTRNTPSIFAKQGRLFWDGRADSIGDLVMKPIQNHIEMKFDDLNALAAKLAKTTYYSPLFKKAYGTPDISVSKIKRALSEFVKNFNFSDNKFNQANEGDATLTALEKTGQDVFNSKGNCSNCHHLNSGFSGYGFTNFDANIGLDAEYSDNGTYSVTKHPGDAGKFMIPVLLNVELTSPYMHDGRFKTLEEVVEHYNSGVKHHPNLDFSLRDFSSLTGLSDFEIFALFDLNQNGEIEEEEIPNYGPARLNLTEIEKKALVAFLKTLTDNSILTDRRFADPFKK